MNVARRGGRPSSLPVIAAILLLITSLPAVAEPPDGGGRSGKRARPIELPFETGFEKTAVGAFPSPFAAVPGRLRSHVTDAKARGGRRSLKVEGRGEIPACPSLVLPMGLDRVTYEVCVHTGLAPNRQVFVGLFHLRERSGRFENSFILRRRDSEAVVVCFRGAGDDGAIPLMTVMGARWVKLRASLDFRNRTARLWLNGQPSRKVIPAHPQRFTGRRGRAVVLDRWGIKEPNRRGEVSEIFVDDVRIWVDEARGEFEEALARLSAEEAHVRMTAAEALGRLGDARATRRLIAALGDEDTTVRAAVASALGRLGDPRALEPLRKLHGEGSLAERAAAAVALARLGSPVEPEKPGIVDLLGRGQWRQVAKMGPDAVEPSIEALKHADPRVRRNAADALGALSNARAVEPLIAALEDPKVRSSAAGALGELGDRRAVEPLTAHLDDPEPYVRSTVMYALACIGGKRAIGVLLGLLEKPGSRVRAASALAFTGHEKGREVLIESLEDGDPEIRRAAADALGGLLHSEQLDGPQSKRVAACLAKTLADEDIMVSRIAAECLAGIDDPGVIAALVKALEGGDFMRFEMAGQALAKTVWKPTTDAQRAVFLTACWKFDDAAKLGEPAVAPLVAALAVDHERARFLASRALGTMGAVAKPAIPALLRVAKNEKEEGLIRLAAARAIEAIQGK